MVGTLNLFLPFDGERSHRRLTNELDDDCEKQALMVDTSNRFLPFDGEHRRLSNELEEEKAGLCFLRGLRVRSLDLCDRLRRGLSSVESELEPRRLRPSREDDEEEELSARRDFRLRWSSSSSLEWRLFERQAVAAGAPPTPYGGAPVFFSAERLSLPWTSGSAPSCLKRTCRTLSSPMRNLG